MSFPLVSVESAAAKTRYGLLDVGHLCVVAFVSSLVLSLIVLTALPAASTALDDNPGLSLVKDAAGLFNERGYMRSNSFSVDGNEVINDYNGNLIWSRTLDYLSMTQNGIHFDLKLTYNGSVGHTLRNCIGDGCSLANVESINSPEWIISVNNVAIQTFNFENEALLWETQSDVSENDDVSLLINGYHSCYTYKPSVFTNDNYGTISILTGDGGVRQFYSIDHNQTFCQQTIAFEAVTGEYRSFNKDDRARGYLDCESGDFTLFEEDGSRIRFMMYRPQWNTAITTFVPLNDSLIQFVPIEFLDHQGHSLRVSYATSYIGGSERIPGRPIVTSAGPYGFDWHGLLSGWTSQSLTLSCNGDQYSVLFRGPVGGVGPQDTRNRGQVIRIVDAAHNATSFDYCYYKRTGTGLNNFNHGTNLDTGEEFDVLLARLKSVTDPFGGIRHYTYYNDLQSKWGANVSLTDILNIDYDRVCLNPEIYPCQKTTWFDLIGRDPYYTNIVTARRRASGDSAVLAFDSLVFSWVDENERIDTTDQFTTKRYYAPRPDSLVVGRSSLLTYRQFPKPGPYAASDRDRGWELKLMQRHELDGEGAVVQQQISYWDRLTFLMDSSISVRDDIVTKSSVSYQWNGPRSLDTVNNLVVKTSIDPWGLSTITEYVDDYFIVSSPNSVYFNSLVHDTKVKQGSTVLSHESYEYYDGTSGPGFVGQLCSASTYPIVDGVEQSPLISRYEYFSEYSDLCQRATDFGALRKEINPKGDSVTFHYYEEIENPPGYVNPHGGDYATNPVMFKYEWRGDTATWSDQRSFLLTGPFWYKQQLFTNAPPQRLIDTLYLPDSCLTKVKADQNYQGFESVTDTITIDQDSIRCRLTMPGTTSGYCDWDGENSYAKIEKNGVTVDSIWCQTSRQDIIFWTPVDVGDIVSARIYHASTHGENYQAAFWHLTCPPRIDTIVDTSIYPGAITNHRYVTYDARTLKSVNPNGFVSELSYDPLDRVEQIVLPGNFESTDPRFVSTPALLSLDAIDDGSLIGGQWTPGSGLLLEGSWKADDSLLFAADSNLCPPVNFDDPCPRKLNCPRISFKLSQDMSQFGFDSAFLYFELIDTATIIGPVHPQLITKVSTKGTSEFTGNEPTCPGAENPTTTVGYFDPSLGQQRVPADVIFNRLRDTTNGRVFVYIEARYSISGLPVDQETDCFSMAIASSEHPDPAKRPRLEIFGKWYRDGDSVFTMLYEYDDATIDGDGIDITTHTRLDYVHPPTGSRIDFDDLARPNQRNILYPNGSIYASAQTRYDYWDRKVADIDPLGMQTAHTYDALDRLLSTKSPDEAGTPTYARAMDYAKAMAADLDFPDGFNFADSQLLRTQATDENGNQVWNYADVLGRNRVTITTPDGTTLFYTYFDYDNLGNLTKIIRPKGDSVLYWYNSLGWVLKEWSNDYDTISYSYDANGNVIAKQDGNQGARSLSGTVYKSYYRYDGVDRLLESGEMAIVGSDTTFVALRRSVYDQTTTENGSGELSLSFSVNNRGSYGEEYHYDPRGRLKRQVNYFEAQLDSTLVDGRYLYSLSGMPHTIEFTYNYADQITSITYPTGIVVTYEYDEFGRVSKVGDGSTADSYAGLSYTTRDEISQLVLAQGLQTIDYDYNARRWLKTINNGELAGGDLFAEQLRYYECGSDVFCTPQFNGNISSQEIYLPLTPDLYYSRYTYDQMDRLLTAATAPGYAEEVFQYDVNGNRVTYRQQWVDGPTPLPDVYSYTPSTNQIASRQKALNPATVFSYDENGNMSWDESRNAQYSYDSFNQLSNVIFPLEGIDDDEINYGYAADGQRVFKRYKHYWQEECGGGGGIPEPDPESPPLIGSLWNRIGWMIAVGEGGTGELCTYSSESSVWYLVGNGKVLAEYTDPEGAPYRQYIYAGDKLIAIHSHTDGRQYVIADHLGSTRVVFDTAGTVRNAYLYTAFGDTRPGTIAGTAQPMRYTGKILDGDNGLNLYYYGSRYQAPDVGGFTQIDPQAGRTPSWSPYVYTLDNPMKYVDPDGEGIWFIFWAAATIVAAFDEYANAPTHDEDIYEKGPDDRAVDVAEAAVGIFAGYFFGKLIESAFGETSDDKVEPETSDQTDEDEFVGPKGGKSWTTKRRQYWKKKAAEDPERFDEENRARAEEGKPEQRENPETGKKESKHLHHKKPRSEGGKDTRENLEEQWPDDHRKIHKKKESKE